MYMHIYYINCILPIQKKDFDHVKVVMEEVVASRDNLLVSPKLSCSFFSFNFL